MGKYSLPPKDDKKELDDLIKSLEEDTSRVDIHDLEMTRSLSEEFISKKVNFHLKLAPDEREMLRTRAYMMYMTQSQYIGFLIRSDYVKSRKPSF